VAAILGDQAENHTTRAVEEVVDGCQRFAPVPLGMVVIKKAMIGSPEASTLSGHPLLAGTIEPPLPCPLRESRNVGPMVQVVLKYLIFVPEVLIFREPPSRPCKDIGRGSCPAHQVILCIFSGLFGIVEFPAPVIEQEIVHHDLNSK